MDEQPAALDPLDGVMLDAFDAIHGLVYMVLATRLEHDDFTPGDAIDWVRFVAAKGERQRARNLFEHVAQTLENQPGILRVIDGGKSD